jgi:hypothetical protein
VPDGSLVHDIRESADYAIALLQTKQPDRAERASDVLDRIASLQVTDPTATHFGIWGWFLEEPPQQMNPADWNWADFIGARLAQVLAVHADQLRAETLRHCREALRNAALSIFRRNMGAGYTNIAVMGGVVSAAAGELLDLPFLLTYAKARLRSVLDLYRRLGGFSEYNSPTYTRVVLEETERALLMVRDEETRRLCEELRVAAWQTLADHWHPATRQIAGPCSRAYSDRLLRGTARYLLEQTGQEPPSPDDDPPGFLNSTTVDYCVVPALPCPPAIRARFLALPSDPHVIRQRYGSNQYGDVIGTTWFSGDACLGTISHDITWVQRRPLLAYWRLNRSAPATLRARLLRDGEDLACGYVWQTQDFGSALTAWSLCHGAGDHHPVFGRRPDSVFEMTDLRVRYQLTARDAAVEQVGAGCFELRAGAISARIAISPDPRWNDVPARVVVGREQGRAWVDVELYVGPQRKLDCVHDRLQVAVGLSIGADTNAALASGPRRVGSTDGSSEWQWGTMRLTCPDRPMPFEW